MPKRRSEFEVARKIVTEKSTAPVPGKILLMRNVLFAVKNELPISMAENLHKLIDAHLSHLDGEWRQENVNKQEVSKHKHIFYTYHNASQSDELAKSPFRIPGMDFHTSNYSTYEFLNALNKHVEEIELDKLKVNFIILPSYNGINKLLSVKAANSFTLHVDESTDISKTKLLLLYTQHVNTSDQVVEQGFRKVLALERTDAEALCKAILDYFEEKGIDGTKMVMLTSDGANVMLGWQNGTTARIKRALNCSHVIAFHCVAHLQALGIKDTCKVIITILSDIFAICKYHVFNLDGKACFFHAIGTHVERSSGLSQHA